MLFLLSWASTRNCFCSTWKHSFHSEYPLERKLTPLIRSLNIFISPLHFKRFVPFSYVLHVCMLVWGREGDRYGSNSTEPRAPMPKGTTTFTPSFTGSHHLGWHCHCQWEEVSVFLRKKRRKATAELHALGKLLASSHISLGQNMKICTLRGALRDNSHHYWSVKASPRKLPLSLVLSDL